MTGGVLHWYTVGTKTIASIIEDERAAAAKPKPGERLFVTFGGVVVIHAEQGDPDRAVIIPEHGLEIHWDEIEAELPALSFTCSESTAPLAWLRPQYGSVIQRRCRIRGERMRVRDRSSRTKWRWFSPVTVIFCDLSLQCSVETEQQSPVVRRGVVCSPFLIRPTE